MLSTPYLYFWVLGVFGVFVVVVVFLGLFFFVWLGFSYKIIQEFSPF